MGKPLVQQGDGYLESKKTGGTFIPLLRFGIRSSVQFDRHKVGHWLPMLFFTVGMIVALWHGHSGYGAGVQFAFGIILFTSLAPQDHDPREKAYMLWPVPLSQLVAVRFCIFWLGIGAYGVFTVAAGIVVNTIHGEAAFLGSEMMSVMVINSMMLLVVYGGMLTLSYRFNWRRSMYAILLGMALVVASVVGVLGVVMPEADLPSITITSRLWYVVIATSFLGFIGYNYGCYRLALRFLRQRVFYV